MAGHHCSTAREVCLRHGGPHLRHRVRWRADGGGRGRPATTAWVTIRRTERSRSCRPPPKWGKGRAPRSPSSLRRSWTPTGRESGRAVAAGRQDLRNPRYGIMYTAGSASIPAYFKPLRLAAAQARRVLIEASPKNGTFRRRSCSPSPARWCTKAPDVVSAMARSPHLRGCPRRCRRSPRPSSKPPKEFRLDRQGCHASRRPLQG